MLDLKQSPLSAISRTLSEKSEPTDGAPWGQNVPANLIFAVLSRTGCGQAVISNGQVIEACATARSILERQCAATRASPAQLYEAIKLLMAQAGARFPVGAITWLATSFTQGFTIVLPQTLASRPQEPRLILIVDLDARLTPNPATLRELFGLTAAETRIALELARGNTLTEIANAHQLSRTTIRSQLASLFMKTQTRRQSELIALLARVSLLP